MEGICESHTVPTTDSHMELMAQLLQQAKTRGFTVGTAESLTGGAVCAALCSIPGASDVVRGGVIAYATDIKASLLKVDPQRLSETGPVDEQVARQMALGVCEVMGTDIGLATTGVAGPGPADGHRAGTVHIACALNNKTWHKKLCLTGGRNEIREATVAAVIELALVVIGNNSFQGLH